MKELEESGSNRRICVTMPSDEHVIAFARRLMSVLAPNIRAASTQATQGVAAVLAMLRELALLPYTGFMLLQPLPGADTPVVDHVIAILGTNNVSLAAGKACLEILQFLLQSVYVVKFCILAFLKFTNADVQTFTPMIAQISTCTSNVCASISQPHAATLQPPRWHQVAGAQK